MDTFPSYLNEIVAFSGKSVRTPKQFRFLVWKTNAAIKAHQKAGLKVSSIRFHMEPTKYMISFKFDDCWVSVDYDTRYNSFYVSVHKGNPDEIVGIKKGDTER